MDLPYGNSRFRMDHPRRQNEREAACMRVLSWNVRGIRGIGGRLTGVLDAIASDAADVVTLQEVSARGTLYDRLRHGLRDRGYTTILFSGTSAMPGKPYGNVLASRFPLRSTHAVRGAGQAWPQLVNAAVVDHPHLGAIEVVTAHIPNGSGNGWRKVDAFEALAAALGRNLIVPLILTGDFNEPASRTDDGGIVSFGQTVRAAEPTREGDLQRLGETHPRRRWDDAVRAVLDGPRLRLVTRTLGRPVECTHVVRGRARSFDHILVSAELRPRDAGYHHEWRTCGLSDHSAAWVSVTRTGCSSARGQPGG